MTDLLARLHAIRPLVEKVRLLSGAAGVSVGIIHDAKVVLTENFGYRNVESKIRPDQDTIYYLASLTKSITAAGIAHLIKENPAEITWDKPVYDVWDKLKNDNADVREHATVLDCLAHRTGLAPKNHLWSQEYGHFTMRRGQEIRTFTYLEQLAEVHSRWIYNNWGYALADELIEHIGKISWDEYLKTRIFDQVGMLRTFTEPQDKDENAAQGYVALENGEFFPIDDPDDFRDGVKRNDNGTILEGALAVRSCIRDLTKYYIAFMRAVKAEQAGRPSQEPFVDAMKMIEPHIKLSTKSDSLEGSYGLGWVMANLPCTLGAIGLNHAFVGKMPVVGRDIPQKTACYYHQGSSNAFLSSVYLLPESESGVVVLTNSMAQNDAADWVGELYLEAILDCPRRNDYVTLAKTSAEAALALWPAMRKELNDNQIPGTPIRPLTEYAGVYSNRIDNYRIEIFQLGDDLLMRFQRGQITYKLTHYHHDSFSWLITHDCDAKLGRFPITRASFYLIHFSSQDPGKTAIDSLIWAHDDEVLKGEIFVRRSHEHIQQVDAPEAPVVYLAPDDVAEQADVLGGALEVVHENEHEHILTTEDADVQREIIVIDTELEDKTGATQPDELRSIDDKL